MHDADKEKTKLLATALNNLGVAIVTIGFVTPLIAFLYKAASAPPIEAVVALSGIWLATGAVLHVIARLILEDMRR